MAKTDTTIDQSTYTSNERVITLPAVSKDYNTVGFGIDRTGWTDPTSEIAVNVDQSFDDGKSWQFWYGFTCRGGNAGPLSSWRMEHPPAKGVQLRVRVRANKPTKQDLKILEDTKDVAIGPRG